MAVSTLAPTDWHFPNASSAPMDHQAKQNGSSSAPSSSKSVTISPTTANPAPTRHDSASSSDPRQTPNQHNESPKPSPPMNGQFVPYGMPPQATWSPQLAQQQPGFGYPGMYGYFPQQQAQFPPFDPSQQPNAQQFSQWAAYQQMLFNAQQQQQQQIAAAVAAGMMPPRQRTGSSPQSPPDFAQAFMVNGQLPPGMMNNGAFSPMAFPNGPGVSGATSGRGSAASEPSNNNQAFHPYRRNKGSQSTSNSPSPASSNSPSLPSPPTIAGLPSSAFPPLQAAQPPYARERTNSNSSANSSRSSRSGAGGNRSHPGTRSASGSTQPPPPPTQHRSSSSTSGSNGRTTPSQGRPSDASSARPSGGGRNGSSSNGNHPSPAPQPRARTPSSSSASSSPSSPSTPAPALPVANSAQNATGSVRSRAPPKPSPLSQQPSISAEITPMSKASKRLSKDDSDLKAYGETVHAHIPRSAGLKGRLRRALSLAPSGSLTEDERADVTTPKLGSRKQVVAAKNNAEQARAAAAAAAAGGSSAGEKKAAPVVVATPLPLSPTTPTSTHSGSTIGAGAGSITPPGSPALDENASDAPPDPSIRSTKKKPKAGSLFNRKWNASTDNISLSSTVSSASLMIRKIGSVGALARRKSLTGITNLFKDKDKNKEKGEKADKKSKAGVSSAGVSQVHAEFDRGDLVASGSDDMVGLSPAAKLARQHTLRSNAEAAARAKQQELLRQQQEQQQQQPLRRTGGGNSVSGKHLRNVSEDGSEDGFTHISYSGLAGGEPQAYLDEEDEDEGEDMDDGNVTVRHESMDLEVEPWAQNIRRSIERTRVPTRGILKHSGSYKQEEDLKQSRNHSLNRSRANSYDNLGLSSRSSEPGPLAHIPSANPDQIDGLQSPQSGSDVDGLLPPLNFMDISNFSDSPVSSTTTLQGSLASSLGTTHISSANSEKTGAGSVYMHPGMNSSAPALSLMAKGDENASLGQRSQTTPAPSSKKITFAANLSVYDTFSPGSYDRRSEPATCNHLTPALAQRIKEELNSYKMEEMEVHFASRAHTQFFV